MNAKTQQLLDEVLRLPEQERWALVDEVLDQIEPDAQEDEASFWDKIDQRAADIQDGKVAAIPADDVHEMARRRLRKS